MIDWATHGHKPRPLAGNHGHKPGLAALPGTPSSASANVFPPPPIFQAGHEGPIPFARSNPKSQVSGTTDIIAAKIMLLLRARVPDRRLVAFFLAPASHCP